MSDAAFDQLLADMWEAVQRTVTTPLFLSFLCIGGGVTVALFVLKRVLVSRARRLMMRKSWATNLRTVEGIQRGWTAEDDIRARIDVQVQMTWRWVWLALREPTVHAACWFIAGPDEETFGEVAALSQSAALFGGRLPDLAWKVMKDQPDDPVRLWSQLMDFADHPADVHERLAAPGYTMTVSLISVEQGIPLEYAAALV